MEELERKCMICGHVFTLDLRGRKKKTCSACRERILQEHDKYEAEFNRGEKPAPDFCIVCGKQIDNPRTRKYTCSPTCRREMVNVVGCRWQRKKRKIMKLKRMQEKAREKEERDKDAEFAKEIKKQFRKGHRPPKPKTYTPISIHAPVKGATADIPASPSVYRHFNPRTREGCDPCLPAFQG